MKRKILTTLAALSLVFCLGSLSGCYDESYGYGYPGYGYGSNYAYAPSYGYGYGYPSYAYQPWYGTGYYRVRQQLAPLV